MTVVGIILILIGLSALTGVSLINFIIALVLIVIGIRMITGHSWRWGGPGNGREGWGAAGSARDTTSASTDELIDETVVFSGLDKTFTPGHFRGGKIVMVFSNGHVDLSGAKTDLPEPKLRVSSTFSHLEITVPKEWNVRSHATVFAGGINIQTGEQSAAAVTLHIYGDATFGEVVIRPGK